MEKDVTAILRCASERGLPSLLIGGNAVILLGYFRNTVDLDLLLPEQSRSRWLDLLHELGYRFFHGGDAFAQFEPPERSAAPVDLMFVDQATWEKLINGGYGEWNWPVSAPSAARRISRRFKTACRNEPDAEQARS